jgi:hypothetical protein
MVTSPNTKHQRLMVKLRYQLGRLITSLLPLTLVSAVLMLGSPAFADDLSGSTCAADVVFLWDQKHFAGCGLHGGWSTPRKKAVVPVALTQSMRAAPGDPMADEYGRVAVGAAGGISPGLRERSTKG